MGFDRVRRILRLTVTLEGGWVTGLQVKQAKLLAAL